MRCCVAAKKEVVEMLDVHPGGEYIGDDALIAKLRALEGQIECNPPDFSLYSWAGSLWLNGKKFCNVRNVFLQSQHSHSRATTAWLNNFWRAGGDRAAAAAGRSAIGARSRGHCLRESHVGQF